jgi:hypothetical protein
MNEMSWTYYTEWFWYLGWFEHRFEIARSSWLDTQTRPCPKEQAAFMKVTLRKVATTPFERTVARTMQPDFGGIGDDLLVTEMAAAMPHESITQTAVATALSGAIQIQA